MEMSKNEKSTGLSEPGTLHGGETVGTPVQLATNGGAAPVASQASVALIVTGIERGEKEKKRKRISLPTNPGKVLPKKRTPGKITAHEKGHDKAASTVPDVYGRKVDSEGKGAKELTRTLKRVPEKPPQEEQNISKNLHSLSIDGVESCLESSAEGEGDKQSKEEIDQSILDDFDDEGNEKDKGNASVYEIVKSSKAKRREKRQQLQKERDAEEEASITAMEVEKAGERRPPPTPEEPAAKRARGDTTTEPPQRKAKDTFATAAKRAMIVEYRADNPDIDLDHEEYDYLETEVQRAICKEETFRDDGWSPVIIRTGRSQGGIWHQCGNQSTLEFLVRIIDKIPLQEGKSGYKYVAYGPGIRANRYFRLRIPVRYLRVQDLLVEMLRRNNREALFDYISDDKGTDRLPHVRMKELKKDQKEKACFFTLWLEVEEAVFGKIVDINKGVLALGPNRIKLTGGGIRAALKMSESPEGAQSDEEMDDDPTDE